jgi:hypothetical protein
MAPRSAREVALGEACWAATSARIRPGKRRSLKMNDARPAAGHGHSRRTRRITRPRERYDPISAAVAPALQYPLPWRLTVTYSPTAPVSIGQVRQTHETWSLSGSGGCVATRGRGRFRDLGKVRVSRPAVQSHVDAEEHHAREAQH